MLTDSDETRHALATSLLTLERVLNVVDWPRISRRKNDAWLYFYEDFLAVYDNDLRKATGSCYTPPEVVAGMVALVDEALRRPGFDRPRGMASAEVTLGDRATGTVTFMLGVLRQIAKVVAAAEAVALGSRVVWLHSFGERFADAADGRPVGPPPLPAGQRPQVPAGGAIPGDEAGFPNDMSYDLATQRLHIGAGFIAPVPPAVWAYEVSGKQVLVQWFS